jgi:hypothetical protein
MSEFWVVKVGILEVEQDGNILEGAAAEGLLPIIPKRIGSGCLEHEATKPQDNDYIKLSLSSLWSLVARSRHPLRGGFWSGWRLAQFSLFCPASGRSR